MFVQLCTRIPWGSGAHTLFQLCICQSYENYLHLSAFSYFFVSISFLLWRRSLLGQRCGRWLQHSKHGEWWQIHPLPQTVKSSHHWGCNSDTLCTTTLEGWLHIIPLHNFIIIMSACTSAFRSALNPYSEGNAYVRSVGESHIIIYRWDSEEDSILAII